jgi:glycerol kinase
MYVGLNISATRKQDLRVLLGTYCFDHEFLLQNLTGGKNGGIYITDVTNASRTMLMNIKSLQWDSTLCRYVGP